MDLQTAPAVHPPLLDSVTEETLRRNVAKVLETLAENRYQDSPPAKLVAVTKTVTPRVINLLKPMEIWDIGENRAQVALPKLPEISPEFHLHWIGRLQTNKVKYIIDHVCGWTWRRRSTAAPGSGDGCCRCWFRSTSRRSPRRAVCLWRKFSRFFGRCGIFPVCM